MGKVRYWTKAPFCFPYSIKYLQRIRSFKLTRRPNSDGMPPMKPFDAIAKNGHLLVRTMVLQFFVEPKSRTYREKDTRASKGPPIRLGSCHPNRSPLCCKR